MAMTTARAMAMATATETGIEMVSGIGIAMATATGTLTVTVMATATTMAMSRARATAMKMAMAVEMVTAISTAMAMATATVMATQCCHCLLSLNHPCHHHVSHRCAPPPLQSSPSPLTSLAHPSISHSWQSPLLVDCCMFMGGRSKRNYVVIACAPPFPPRPSSASPITNHTFPPNSHHNLQGHHD